MGLIIFILVLVSVIVTIAFLGWLGIIPSRFPLKRFDEKEIILERRQGLTKQLRWDNITAISPAFSRFDMNYCTNFFFELTDGTNVGFVIIEKSVPNIPDVDSIPKKLYNFLRGIFTEKNERKYVGSTLQKLYDVFLENLKSKQMDVQKVDFSHPTRWIKSKQSFFKMHCILFALCVLATGYLGRNLVGWGPYLFPLPFLIIFVIIVLREWLLNRGRKCLLSAKVSENQLTCKDEDGQSQTKNLSQVKSFKLDKIKGYLEFSDGTKLLDLEKLRYWPILREYLLSELEPPEKHENK